MECGWSPNGGFKIHNLIKRFKCKFLGPECIFELGHMSQNKINKSHIKRHNNMNCELIQLLEYLSHVSIYV